MRRSCDAARRIAAYNGAMRLRSFRTLLAVMPGAALLILGVYHEIPAWLGMAGVVALAVGGVWAMRSSGVERRDFATTHYYGTVDASNAVGDMSHDHHHGAGHDSGFDAGAVFGSDGGGGIFDSGGGFDGGGGGGDGGGG